jgi:hypothetical protein
MLLILPYVRKHPSLLGVRQMYAELDEKLGMARVLRRKA